MSEKKKIEVKCPGCSKKFNYYDSKSRPFCCDKCKLLDMGQWLNESHVIEGRTNSVYIENPELLEKLMSESDESY